MTWQEQIADWCGRCGNYHTEGDHTIQLLLPPSTIEGPAVVARKRTPDRHLTLGAVCD